MSATPPVALVTGAASGIGRACALMLAEHGHALVLADLDAAGLAATAETAGVDCVRIEADLARTEDVDRLAAACADRFGRLDALLQIAGIGCYKPFWELRRDEIDRVLAVNVASLLELAGRCVPLLAEQRGAIVNMASVRAFRGGPELSAYAATKGAVISMTRAMAHELGPRGIRVNALCPGTIDTPLLDRYAASSGNDPVAFKSSLSDEQPLGRIGTPEDVARAALFLATPASEWITGTTLTVDGGLTA
jgi:NAD(P)-dependent dehydrogenase (short-subunit alcohol dehydrogenase family)